MAKRKSDRTDAVLATVDAGRRQALKKMIAGAAFIAPAIVSLPLALVGGGKLDAASQIGPPPTYTTRPPRPHS